MNKRIEEDILLLPNKPGVYQMKNELGEIIYIGKAKNLKNRVSQYFLRPQNGKTQAMVSHVDHFEIIITRSEKEAFILEMNLIQKYLPRYNILLKDDKHYPYIALHKTKDPYISIARNLKDKKCEYFGPYPLSSNAYQMVDLLNKLFPLRKCKNVPKIPCLYYHLNQCLAPCINKINPDKYDKIFDSIRKFLKGDNKEVLLKIKEKILYYSNNLDFENANEYKKYLEAINHINDRQNVELFDKIDRDIFAYTLDKNYLSLSIFIYREGILIGKRNFTYELVGETIEFVSNLICQYYLYNKLPDEIVIGNKEVSEKISSILEVKTIVPTKGKLFELLTLAKVNSKEDLDEHFVSARLNDNNLELLENLLLSGFDKSTSVELITSSLIQQNAEMFATLDIAIIDLYQGTIEMMKSGACPTYIKHNKKVQLIKSASLPAGIVEQNNLQVFDRDIEAGEILLMCTDGILDSNIEYKNKELWVKYLLEDIETNNTKKIADLVLNEAIDNNFGKAKDDMSVIVCKFLEKDEK